MPERKPGELEKINGEEKPGELDNAMLRMAGAESPEDREEPLTKGTLGEAVSADVESAMREQAGQNQEKIDAILEGALKIYEEAKKTGPIHEAIEKADEFMDSAAREAGIGVGRVMELFTEKIPPDELARASPEVTAGERNEEIPVSPRDVVEKPTPAPAPAETVTAEPKASASAEATADKPAEAAPLSARPEARPRTESEISEEEKDAITQATLDVFRQELKTASVSVAEEAARGKFKETAGNLDKKTYEELRQKVTQEINALEAEERKKMKVAETAAEIKPKTPEPEKPAEIPPDTEKPASVPSEVEENQVEGPAPAELPAEEKPQTAKTETAEAAELPPPSELTAEELEAIFAVANKAETIKDIENLPEAAKEKLGLGFNNLGFYVEENKNKFFAGTIEKAAEKLNLDQKGTWGPVCKFAGRKLPARSSQSPRKI